MDSYPERFSVVGLINDISNRFSLIYTGLLFSFHLRAKSVFTYIP